MIALTYKAKNYATLALKVGILTLSFYYLYTKLIDQQVYLESWIPKFRKPTDLSLLVGLLLMSALNWLMESKKWQLLVQTFTEITYRDALKQTLISLTSSVATPNRIGEYGAKAYFFTKDKAKRILFLNGLGNLAQMAITLIFGILGFLWWGKAMPIAFNSMKMVGFLLLLMVIVVILIQLTHKIPMLKSLKVRNLISNFQRIPSRTKVQVLFISVGRYLLFSTQFYLALLFLGGDFTLSDVLPVVYVMYLAISILPMLPFLDVIVKGSVAVWLFQWIPISEFLILATVLGLWIFNLVIPSIFGSFLLIKAPN